MAKFLRKVRVTFNGGYIINPSPRVEQNEIKVSFNVSKSITSTANTATISIWNLMQGHRNAVGKELDEVVLEAGYEDDVFGIIFKGQLRDIKHRREGANGTDIVSTLSSGDGDSALRTAFISKTYPAGTPAEDVIAGVYDELAAKGITKGEWRLPDELPTYERPYSTVSSAKRELDTLSRGHGFYWSIQNGAMEVIPKDGLLPGSPILIAPQTGMIDVPTVTDNGIEVRTMLDPNIRPNRQIQVLSSVINIGTAGGTYRVSNVSHTGDNFDGPFQTSVKGEKLQGNKVDEGFATTLKL